MGVLDGRLEPVHPGHLDVHQGEVVRDPAEQVNGREAVATASATPAESVEHHQGDLLVGGVVLDEQDGRRALEMRRHPSATRRGRASSAGAPPPRTVTRVSYSEDVRTGLATTAANRPDRFHAADPACDLRAEQDERDRGRAGIGDQRPGQLLGPRPRQPRVEQRRGERVGGPGEP